MKIKALGHVVLRVRDLERSVVFYRDVLGLREVARYGNAMAFFSIDGNHHDLALMEIGPAAGPHPGMVGLHHFALKVGDSIEELRQWRDRVRMYGVQLVGMSDHRVNQALYIRDPDGIEIELYVDANPEVWQRDPAAVATIEPLAL